MIIMTDGLLLAAMVVNLGCLIWQLIALRRLKRINAALFLTLTMAWTMRGWLLDLSDADGPRLRRRKPFFSWVAEGRGNDT